VLRSRAKGRRADARSQQEWTKPEPFPQLVGSKNASRNSKRSQLSALFEPFEQHLNCAAILGSLL